MIPSPEPELWAQAEALAKRSYKVNLTEDELTIGGKVWVANHPTLPGCKAQGNTAGEAIMALAEVRVDYFYHLLDHGIDVPDPDQKDTGWVEDK